MAAHRINSRAKGQRTVAKALRYLGGFPPTHVILLHQASRFATPQPFDLLLLRSGHWPRFVEVRTNAWGVAKPQTRTLSRLPGDGYFRQVWRFKDGQDTPDLRQWDGSAWRSLASPWEGE